MADGSVNVRGARLAYSDEGTGPIVLYAHGLGQSWANDRASGLIDWSALPAAGYRLISYDARGHGGSDGTAEPELYRWVSLAEDLLAVADHFSPDQPVRAMGISMGTASILTAVVRAPGRFAAMALGAPPTAWQTRVAPAAQYDQLARLIEESTAEEVARLLGAGPVPPIFADVEGYVTPPAVTMDLFPSVVRGAGRSDLPSAEHLAAVPVPALILGWETDPGHPVSTAHRLAELLPAARLHLSSTVEDIHTWAARAAAFFDA